MKSFYAVTATIALTAGCTMVESAHLSQGGTTAHIAEMSYALPRLLVKVSLVKTPPKNEGGMPTFRLKFDENQSFYADPLHLYAMQYSGSILSDDIFEVQRDEDSGFISYVDGKATDRTADVAANVGQIAGLNANPVQAGSELIETLLFDPHIPAELAAVNAKLRRHRLALDCPECAPPVAPGRKIDGIYYRPSVHVRLNEYRLGQIRDPKSGQMVETRELTNVYAIRSPNGSPLVAMPVKRSAGVTRTTQYHEFGDGAPQKVVVNKPSEALGLTKGTLGLIGGMVAAPVVGAADEIATLGTTSEEDISADLMLEDAKLKTAEAESKAAQDLARAETLKGKNLDRIMDPAADAQGSETTSQVGALGGAKGPSNGAECLQDSTLPGCGGAGQ